MSRDTRSPRASSWPETTLILLRTESASSSEVENLTSSATQVALAELDASNSHNARLVVANVRAMNAALELADEINEDAIIAMQHTLLNESAPQHTGKFREEQVWIGGGPISPHTASFVPPHHDRVPERMADLIQFSQRSERSPMNGKWSCPHAAALPALACANCYYASRSSQPRLWRASSASRRSQPRLRSTAWYRQAPSCRRTDTSATESGTHRKCSQLLISSVPAHGASASERVR